MLRSGVPIRMRVTGWSMKPWLPPGSLVLIAPLSAPPQRGDVVLYEAPSGGLIAHRVTAREDERVFTRGDACLEPDAPIELSRILGTVLRVESPFVLPLTGELARAVGRLSSVVFPRLVRLKRAVARLCRLTALRPLPEASQS